MGILHNIGQLAGHTLNALPGYSTLGENITNPNVNYKGAVNPPTPENNFYGATPPAAATTPSSGGNGMVLGASAPAGGSSLPALNQGAVNNTQLTIDQLPALLQAALESEARNHANSTAGFDAQEGQQRDQYGASTTTNQQNYDANFMDSIRAGVKGLSGLFNLLRGTGAAGGTAEDQVRDVVGGTTASDIRNGADTQKANQGQLDTSLSAFLTDLKGKRQQNDDTFENNNRAIQRDSSTQLQDLYGKMAGFYGDAGNSAVANDFMAKAGSLTPGIAANTKTAVSAYDTTPVVVHAPNLTAFAAPSQPDVASVPQDGQVGSGIFTLSKRKDQSSPVVASQGA